MKMLYITTQAWTGTLSVDEVGPSKRRRRRRELGRRHGQDLPLGGWREQQGEERGQIKVQDEDWNEKVELPVLLNELT